MATTVTQTEVDPTLLRLNKMSGVYLDGTFSNLAESIRHIRARTREQITTKMKENAEDMINVPPLNNTSSKLSQILIFTLDRGTWCRPVPFLDSRIHKLFDGDWAVRMSEQNLITGVSKNLKRANIESELSALRDIGLIHRYTMDHNEAHSGTEMVELTLLGVQTAKLLKADKERLDDLKRK